MTIAISVKVNDGVVLAADSASTIVTQGQQGNIAVQNVYTNADKIFNLVKSRPIGVMTWGIGSVGQESIATLIKDLRARLSGEDREADSWKLDKDAGVIEYAQKVQEFFYEEKYKTTFESWKQKPDLGFLVAGFSPKQSLAEEYQIDIKGGVCLPLREVRAQNESGIVWNGESEAISRLVLGYSSTILSLLHSQYNLTDQQLIEFGQGMGPYAAQFVSPAMPIKDAIDLAEFLGETTIKFSRFSPGATTVDGPVEVAVITKHEGFKWIRRKHYYSQELNPPLMSS
jgi:hypothetical protein